MIEFDEHVFQMGETPTNQSLVVEECSLEYILPSLCPIFFSGCKGLLFFGGAAVVFKRRPTFVVSSHHNLLRRGSEYGQGNIGIPLSKVHKSFSEEDHKKQRKPPGS